MSNSKPSSPAEADRPTDETIKETFLSIVIAFVLAFTFRAYVVEAFVIPTGSMAPTLLGMHASVTDDRTGYQFDLDADGLSANVYSPMTGMPAPIRSTMKRSGDRILVLKYLYSVSDPQRWDVVVFKNPVNPTGPAQNYIKRLVGLPNEALIILDGNLYTRPNPTEGDLKTGWQIARKSDRPKVQRDVWQPIYHSQYIPLSQGLAAEWQCPWQAQDDSQWQIKGRRAYRFEPTSATGRGEIRFDFVTNGYTSPVVAYPYNQHHIRTKLPSPAPIEDVRLATTVVPDDTGLDITLQTSARLTQLNQAAQPLLARIDASGHASLSTRTSAGDARTLAEAEIDPLPAGHGTELELWFVDQQASLWIDGEKVLTYDVDLDYAALISRPAPPETPDVRITLAGAGATLHEVELDRDLYYLEQNQNFQQAAGGFRRAGDRVVETAPIVMGPDDFLCFGDNSPRSNDGRFWNYIHPWVRERYFDLEPGDTSKNGLVPRDLLVGRAFFVYWPGPYKYFIPNFGRMRFIH